MKRVLLLFVLLAAAAASSAQAPSDAPVPWRLKFQDSGGEPDRADVRAVRAGDDQVQYQPDVHAHWRDPGDHVGRDAGGELDHALDLVGRDDVRQGRRHQLPGHRATSRW
jgi:hypothetical protein